MTNENLLPQTRRTFQVRGRRRSDDSLQKKERENKTDKQCYKLKETWHGLALTLICRAGGIAYMAAILALGGIGLTFRNSDWAVTHGLVIEGDALLAAMGVISTVTTKIAGWTFCHLSGTILTMWMTGERGVLPSDLHLEEELKDPLAAFARCKAVFKPGNRWKPLLRLLVTLTTGTCVLLVAASVNTIAIPKNRWYPDPRYGAPDVSDDRYYFDNQTSRVGDVSFMNTWSQGWAIVREGGPISWEMSHAVAASRLVSTFSGLYDTVNYDSGWHPIGGVVGLSSTAIRTLDRSDRLANTASIHGDRMSNLYDIQKREGKQSFARRSIGWFANASVPVVLLTTQCEEAGGFEMSSWEAIGMGNATMEVRIGASSRNDYTFQGAQCVINLRQCLFALQQWIVSPNESSDTSSLETFTPQLLPRALADTEIVDTTSAWFNDILPNLQRLFSGSDVLNFTSVVVQMADNVASTSPDYDRMDGLSLVVGTIFSSIITDFEWTYADVENSTTRQGPIRWQVYGSGPRLPWEWAISIVPGVLILVHVADICLLLTKRLTVRPWLKIEGMMVAASAAPPMSHISEDEGMGVGVVTPQVEGTRVFMREFRKPSTGTSGIARLVDSEELIDRSAAYTNVRQEAVYGVEG